MSKRKIQLRAFIGALLIYGSMISSGSLSAQDSGGFSIFQPAAEKPDNAPIAVSPKQAFTNPTAKLPTGQFGNFNSKTASETRPQLNGAKAVGPYAATNDGRAMFRQSPNSASAGSGRLKPFAPASNSLRSETRSQAANAMPQQPPIAVGDFQNSARRLGAPNPNRAAAQNPDSPKIGQVAFQEGFNPQNRPQPDNSGKPFGQRGQNGLSQQPRTSGSRFGNGNAQTQPASPRRQSFQQSPPQQSQPQQNSFPNRPTGQQPGQRQQLQQRQQQNTRPPVRSAALPQTPGTNQAGSSIARKTNPGSSNANSANSKSVNSNSAKALLTSWLEPTNGQTELPGKRLALYEFLSQPINGSRKDAINQYWLTFGDMANHNLALQQSQWLDSIKNLRQPADQSVLKAAQQSAQNRVLRTEIQLAKSQAMLNDFLPNFRYKNGKHIPVLPANIPWVGKLNTKYTEYRNRGMVPDRFNGIDEILPKSRQLIANGADSVSAATQAADQARQAVMSGQTPVSNVLEAARIKSRSEQEFLSTVIGYNRAITDYVLSVRQDIFQPKQLASVLIGKNSVQPTVAKNQKPQEDTDPLANISNNPTLRQVSNGRTVRNSSQRNASRSPASRNQASRGFSTASQSNSGRQPSSGTANNRNGFSTASTSEYGPTAASAKAANFDPTKLQEELPMKQAQPSGGSIVYDQQNSPDRSARNPQGRQQPANQRGFGQNPTTNRGGLGNPTGGANRGGAPSGQPSNQINPVTRPKGFPGNQTTPAGFSVGNSTGATGTQAPIIPKNPPVTKSPFSVSPPKSATPGASSSSRFGGGTFGQTGGAGQ